MINETIERKLINNRSRLDFLPNKLGRHFLNFENYFYQFMRRLSNDYNGGYFEYYNLTNEGFYLSLEEDGVFKVENNYTMDTALISADALSITAAIFALSYLSNKLYEKNIANESVVIYCDLLKDYASTHKERKIIYQLID